MNQLVSIVVPIYNVEKYLYQCLTSIINQTYSNLEIILVNDGSTDNSMMICEKFYEMDSRIRIINKKNGGLSDARNAGIDIASGKYIIFIDSDDFVEVELVEKLIKYMSEYNLQVLTFGFYVDIVNGNEDITESFISSTDTFIVTEDEFSKININTQLIGNMGYAWNKMYDLDFIRKNNFKFIKGLSLIEDIMFNTAVFMIANNIGFIADPLVHYVQRSRETLGNKYYADYFSLRIEAIKQLEILFKKWNIATNEIEKNIANIVFNTIKLNIKMLISNHNMNFNEKNRVLKNILHDEYTLKVFNDYKPNNIKDFIIMLLMKYKRNKLLLLIYKILV